MQFCILVVLPWLLLCAADHRTVRGERKRQVAQQRSIDHDAQLFEEFVRDYNRTYEADEYKRRFDLFRKNLDKIDRRNANYETPVHGINEFADWTTEEFQRLQGLRNYSFMKNNCTYMREIPDVRVPDELDYRKLNMVTNVKNQGYCGSCWAFCTIGNIEGQYAKKYKKLVSFSEQQLEDCIANVNCEDGYDLYGPDYYVKEAGGLMTEDDYPYVDYHEPKCLFDPKKVTAKLSGCEDWVRLLSPHKDEAALKKVLVSRGPIAFTVLSDALNTYKGGILQGEDCPASMVDHGVLLVGYGKENGTPYWLVKNSWGKRFGEGGYFRMQYGVNCLGMIGEANCQFANAIVA